MSDKTPENYDSKICNPTNSTIQHSILQISNDALVLGNPQYMAFFTHIQILSIEDILKLIQIIQILRKA